MSQQSKCKTPYCRRSKAHRSSLCHTCKSRKYRAAHPDRYAYNNLKSNSKRRNIEFSLSFTEFQEFCYKTEYLVKKGKSIMSLTVDRIDSERGYHADNIQVLTLRDNAIKGRKVLTYDWHTKYATVITTQSPFKKIEEEDLPF